MPGNTPIHVASEDQGQLEQLACRLAELADCPGDEPEDSRQLSLIDPETGARMELPEALVKVLSQSARVLANGGAVAVLPYHAQMTTQEAADYLGVSRPYFISLLDEGVIPYERLRSHRRILLSDVQAYRQQRDAERRELLDEMARESYRLGFYNLPEDVDLADLGIDE